MPPLRRTYLLIHGSWHDGSAWNAVAEVLRAHGHQVFAPDLVGQNTTEVAQHLAEYVRKQDLRDLYVVGWSYGGIVLQALFPLIPDRVAMAIFFDAFVLPDVPGGMSLMDEVGSVAPNLVSAFQSLVDPATQTLLLPQQVFHDLFISDAPERATQVYATLHAEPWGRVTERIDTGFFCAAIPRDVQLDDGTTVSAHEVFARMSGLYLRTAYIVALQDQALGPDFWPGQAECLGPLCSRVTLREGAHEAAFTQPKALATAILEASGDQTEPQSAAVIASGATLPSEAPSMVLSAAGAALPDSAQSSALSPPTGSQAAFPVLGSATPHQAQPGMVPAPHTAAGARLVEGPSRELPPGRSGVCCHP